MIPADWSQASVWLPLFFLGAMGFAMLSYVVLDGYDLGVGILLKRAGDADNLTLDFDANPGLLAIRDITINLNADSGDLHDDLTIVMSGHSLVIELTSASGGTIEIPNGPRISFNGISRNTLFVGGTSDLVLGFASIMSSLIFTDVDADGVGGLDDGWFRATDNLGVSMNIQLSAIMVKGSV